MAQNFDGAPTGAASLILTSTLPANDEALRTLHSGGTAPSSVVTYMLWADTSVGVLKQYNGSGWTVLGPLNALINPLLVERERLSVGATTTVPLMFRDQAFTVTKIGILTDTASSGSSAGATEWQWGLTAGGSSLFSATVGTGSTDGTIGGGEIAASTAYYLTPDQNADVAAGTVLQFTATKVGSPTPATFALLTVMVFGYFRGS